jgi:hypothetical protein
MGRREKPPISISDPFEVAINRINNVMWAIGGILGLGFITMLLMVAGLVLDAWRFKSNSYEGLIETMRIQEEIINNNEIQQAEIKSLLENIQKDLQKEVSIYGQKRK